MSRYGNERPYHMTRYWKFDKQGNVVLRNYQLKGFRLNRTASEVFTNCNGRHSVQEIVESLARKYRQIPLGQVQADVDNLLERLERDRCLLIRWDPF